MSSALSLTIRISLNESKAEKIGSPPPFIFRFHAFPQAVLIRILSTTASHEILYFFLIISYVAPSNLSNKIATCSTVKTKHFTPYIISFRDSSSFSPRFFLRHISNTLDFNLWQHKFISCSFATCSSKISGLIRSGEVGKIGARRHLTLFCKIFLLFCWSEGWEMACCWAEWNGCCSDC